MKNRLLNREWQPWWKQLLKAILGGNLAVIIKSMRLGAVAGRQASIDSFDACNPLQATSRDALKMLFKIPEVRLSDIIQDSRGTIKLDVQRFEDGMLPMEHAVALLTLAVLENPPAVLEIGTFCGHTTKLLAQNLPKSTIYTVDLPIDYTIEADSAHIPKDDFHLIASRVVGREYRNQPGSDRIVQHFGDTASWDFSLAKDADFFFIDGAHTYDYVKNDSEKCWQLCQGKGVFVWHDCGPGHPGVLRLLTEWRQRMGRNVIRIQGTTLAYLKMS